MDPAEVLLALLTALVAADIGSSQLKLARLERELANKPDRSEWLSLREELSNKPDRSELIALGKEISRKSDREETNSGMTSIWEELRKKPDRVEFDSLRSDIAGFRADLTQIALAVGAQRPRKVE